jgi:predicted 3-demethylubiquinone-9 3-methyltransferase (glyoxalase superfamily)
MRVLFASILVLASFSIVPSDVHSIRIRQAGASTVPQKITTFLWFDQNAEDAVRFYSSAFKDSKILEETRWGAGAPVPEGTLMSARIRLAGQEFIAFNGGPTFKFTEAISLFVSCETQQEIDDLWARLGEGAQSRRCGWIKDKFGVSWQVVPAGLGKMLADKDPAKARRVGEALRGMEKLDIVRLKQAYDGR